ncbi:ABC transporter permease [Bifidobacterium choloepi]|uniref:ABC transporter permease n=1 Tax=Bifidobacterium choloepi TaxID=2614131 RepID=A0A6I5NKU5_9BIFI|nr:ABC transporter permease [Bifidobacterium choloepi]NEG69462.1 ABC transporter permease [Bifidobacterium choloepi]
MNRNVTGKSSRLRIVCASIWRRPTGKFAVVVLGLWIAVAAVSLFWTPRSLWDTDGFNTWAAPSAAHWLGTDGTGADVFSWLMAGSATNLLIAVLAVLVAGLLGTALTAAMISARFSRGDADRGRGADADDTGSVSGTRRNVRVAGPAGSSALAHGSVVAVDALISIPTILVALMLAVPFGGSIWVIVAACGLSYGLNLARVARPAALLVANSAYVEAARRAGGSSWNVLVHHVLPNIRPVMTVQLSMAAGTSVLAEAGLTYLGVGVPSGTASWGHSLATSAKFIAVYPATVLWVGLTVTLAVLALNLFGDALRDAADPLTNPALRQNSARIVTDDDADGDHDYVTVSIRITEADE